MDGWMDGQAEVT